MTNLILSVSQLKTYNASPAKWAGRYILGIEDPISETMELGKLAEHRLITGEDNWDIINLSCIEDKEDFLSDYNAIKYNSQGLIIPKGEYQRQLTGIVCGYPFVGYADIFTDECIYDLKTCRYLTNKQQKSKNLRSGMTTYEEYELQMRIYMKLSSVRQGMIIEVSKNLYIDKKIANQIIPFNMSDEWDEYMTQKWKPIMDNIMELYNQYNFIYKNKNNDTTMLNPS